MTASGWWFHEVGDYRAQNCQHTTNVPARHNIQLAEEAHISQTHCCCSAFCLAVVFESNDRSESVHGS